MDDLPFNLLDRPRAGTIMDMLTRHGISWVNYRPASSDQSEFRRYAQLRRYMRFRRRRARHHLASLGRPLRKTAPPAFLTPPRLPAPALAWGTW
jgi:hypothetical protein